MQNLIARQKQLWLSITVFVGALAGLTPSAHAYLNVCNKTKSGLIFDISVQAPDCGDDMVRNNFRLTGWTYIQPNQCVIATGADLRTTEISWTAEQGTTVWGDGIKYAVPIVGHNQMCLRNVYDYCMFDNSKCRMNEPHNTIVRQSKVAMTLEIRPNRGWYVQ